MKIILATNNQNKVKEIKKIISIKGLRILSLNDIYNVGAGFIPALRPIKIIENGTTFAENAIIKAKIVAKRTGMIAAADDSGLCVDALDGRPGVRSARYVRPPVTLQRLCEKLLKEMKNVPAGKRKAKFVCSVAIASPDGSIKTVTGECRGRIAFEMTGDKGFGYDPVFIPSGYKKTFAQMPVREKNRLSHRGKAFSKARVLLSKIALRFRFETSPRISFQDGILLKKLFQ